MTWSVDASGTQTSTIGTEITLDSTTNNGTFVFVVDISAMQLGDVTELRVYTAVLSGGTANQAWKATFGPNPTFNTVTISPPLASDQQANFTLKQIAGTARSFPWKVLRT